MWAAQQLLFIYCIYYLVYITLPCISIVCVNFSQTKIVRASVLHFMTYGLQVAKCEETEKSHSKVTYALLVMGHFWVLICCNLFSIFKYLKQSLYKWWKIIYPASLFPYLHLAGGVKGTILYCLKRGSQFSVMARQSPIHIVYHIMANLDSR